MTQEPVFTPGQEVVATGRLDGYQNHLTAGKLYTVIEYAPSSRQEGFTWPAYVTVMEDMGQAVTAHTYRFKPLGQ